MSTEHGTCHCGQIEFEIRLAEKSHVLCHCYACKKLSGGEYTLNQIVSKDDLKITKGADSIRKYTYKGDSGNDIYCFYCPTCTTHVYHHQLVLGDKYVVRTGLLDNGRDWPVAAEIYGKDRYKWQPELAETKNVA